MKHLSVSRDGVQFVSQLKRHLDVDGPLRKFRQGLNLLQVGGDFALQLWRLRRERPIRPAPGQQYAD